VDEEISIGDFPKCTEDDRACRKWIFAAYGSYDQARVRDQPALNCLGSVLYYLTLPLLSAILPNRARPLRIEYPGAVHHITSRGNEKKSVSKDDTDW